MEKKQRETRRHQEDIALTRALAWVGGAIVVECLLLFVNRYYINYFVSEADIATVVYSTLRFLRIGGAVAGGVALAWAVLRFYRGQRAGAPLTLGIACVTLAFCSYVTLAFQKSGMRMLFILVPALAGLALVYYLYQREFFFAAAAGGMSVLALWFVRFDGTREALACLAGIVLVAAAVLWLRRSGGVIRRAGGKESRVLSEHTGYGVVFLSCLVGLAAGAAAMVLGANVAYYLIFFSVAWLFALLVYYTVKMM